MNRFARLLDELAHAPSGYHQGRRLLDYLATTPDPDRGWALAIVTGRHSARRIGAASLHKLAASRLDAVLFDLARDHVGDLAETIALMWPAATGGGGPSLDAAVTALATLPREAAVATLDGWLDRLDPDGRWALLKLATGGLRGSVPLDLAIDALATLGGAEPARIAEAFHAEPAPYPGLFACLAEGRMLPSAVGPGFKPIMRARTLEPIDRVALDLRKVAAERLWRGVRVQLVGTDAGTRVFDTDGRDIGDRFPALAGLRSLGATLDGMVLGGSPTGAEPMRAEPHRGDAVFVRAFDILTEGDADLRALPQAERRARLEAWHEAHATDAAVGRHLDLSAALSFASWDDLERHRTELGGPLVAGLVLKHVDAPYRPGASRDGWLVWKREPSRVSTVLMYAARGEEAGARAIAALTLGCPLADGALVPVARTALDLPAEDRVRLETWIHANTLARHGPVVEVARSLLCDVAFDVARRSKRHKAGLVLEGARLLRIRWEASATAADTLASLQGATIVDR